MGIRVQQIRTISRLAVKCHLMVFLALSWWMLTLQTFQVLAEILKDRSDMEACS